MENKTKKWFIRGLLLLTILTMSCTCMPGRYYNNNENEGNDVPAVTVEVEPDESSTPMPTNTEVAISTDTIEPTMDSAAATELAELLESYLQPSQREWSVPAYPGAEYQIDDRAEAADWDEIVEKQARNLSVQEPYFYEFYETPSGLRYADIRDHFMEVVPEMGYKVGSDLQGGHEIYVLTFVDDTTSPQRKIVIQYWRNEDYLMLIYKNPE